MWEQAWLLIDRTHGGDFRLRRWVSRVEAGPPGVAARPYFNEVRLAELPLNSDRARNLLALLRNNAELIRVMDPGWETMIRHYPERAERLALVITEPGPMERDQARRCWGQAVEL
jgi:hypothetical protein